MDLNVIVASPVWSLNGVNTFSANLVRGLRAQGVPAHILLTLQNRPDPKPMPLPTDIPIKELQVSHDHNWNMRWQAMIRYLEEMAPCIYIPNHDYKHSCVSPNLSDRVGVVGIVHSDDPEHYEHVSRLGRFWNAIAAVSKAVAEKTAELDSTFAPRVVAIPHGVDIPASLPERPLDANAPLRIVYVGRLVEYQKRISDLPKIIEALLDRGVPVKLNVIGGGLDQQQLMDASGRLVERGAVRFLGILPNEKVLEILKENDVFLLTSEFEGMPVTLLEAMGRGCIPVVTDIPSGIPELVRNGINGYCVPVGDIPAFADRLSLLRSDLKLRQEVSTKAFSTIDRGGYRLEDMARRYIDLFDRVKEEMLGGVYRRQRGAILPPPEDKEIRHFLSQQSWTNRLPGPVRRAARFGKRTLRKILSAAGLTSSTEADRL